MFNISSALYIGTTDSYSMSYSFAKLEAEGAYALVDMCGQVTWDAEDDCDKKLRIKHLEFHNSCSLSDMEVYNISKGLTNLEKLVVYSFSKVSDAGLDAFFGNVKQLREIHICENEFTDAKFEIMAKHCLALEKVVIETHGSQLTDRTIEAFVEFKTPLVDLTILPIYLEGITYKSIEKLVMECKTLKTLFYAWRLPTHAIAAIANSSVEHLLTAKCDSNDYGNFVLRDPSSLRITWYKEEHSRNAMWYFAPYPLFGSEYDEDPDNGYNEEVSENKKGKPKKRIIVDPTLCLSSKRERKCPKYFVA